MKKLLIFLVIASVLFISAPAMASSDAYTNDNSVNHISSISESQITRETIPVVFRATIRVGSQGGEYDVGFTKIIFPKNFIKTDKWPLTFEVEISALNGVSGIEFAPDTPDFEKNVHIKVDSYKGFLYDKATGKNIFVEIQRQSLSVSHFSRYSFR